MWINNVSSDLKIDGGKRCLLILLPSIGSLVCFEKSGLSFGCQEMGFLRAHCWQWAGLDTGTEHYLYTLQTLRRITWNKVLKVFFIALLEIPS